MSSAKEETGLGWWGGLLLWAVKQAERLAIGGETDWHKWDNGSTSCAMYVRGRVRELEESPFLASGGFHFGKLRSLPNLRMEDVVGRSALNTERTRPLAPISPGNPTHTENHEKLRLRDSNHFLRPGGDEDAEDLQHRSHAGKRSRSRRDEKILCDRAPRRTPSCSP